MCETDICIDARSDVFCMNLIGISNVSNPDS